MAKKKGPNFSSEFRLETALLVVDQGYSQKEAADAMGIGYSTTFLLTQAGILIFSPAKVKIPTAVRTQNQKPV
ncbi:hypothetical protein [Salinimonas chungwhensis]|uniref:hypothetical protein n=1 Tax=Salinimonas chungwhensis TaxID=265425 RepID=UPI0012EAE8B9